VVAAKLHAPRLRDDELPRAVLVDALCSARVPVVAVRAGAGYGKTTTVRQWIERDERASAWLTVDGADNDSVSLLRHLVRALDGIEPLPEVEAVLAADRPRIIEVVLPGLADALAGFRRSFILVLDDVHLLTSPAVGELLEWLVGVLPERSTVALVGRAMPPMRLTRHVVSDNAMVLRRGDLAFTARESHTVLARTVPDLSDGALEALITSAEGWPAGLYLSVLALKGAAAPEQVVTSLTAADGDLGTYFHEELMRGLEPELRSFLVRTSILPRLSSGVCDAVLERTDSAIVLRALAASDNLFVVALDDDPDAYRYHHLFADLLLAELPVEAPGEEAGLRLRAARWLADHGDADGAVHQAVAAGDLDLAASVVLRQLADLIQAGRIETLERWVAQFPPEEARRRPIVALARGWACVARGDFADAGHWLEQLEQLDAAASEEPGGARATTSAAPGPRWLELGRAALTMIQGRGGVKGVVEASHAVQAAGPADNPWWSTARLMEAVASPLADPSVDALGLCAAAEFATRGETTAHVVALAHLAWAQFDRGDERAGQATIARAVEDVRSGAIGDYVLVLHVHVVEAYASARRAARGQAEAAFVRALGTLDRNASVVPRAGCHTRLILAEAALLLEDLELVARLVDDAEHLLTSEPDAVVLWNWVDRLHSTLAERRQQATLEDRLGITAAEARVLAQLPTHRSLEEIGEVLYISRNTVKTHAVSIYRKLGVSGRSAAVDRARTMGLLDAHGALTPSG
jgi:LuxR family maltose regulon positive regulatory protein